MGSKTVNPVTPLVTGAALTKTDTQGTTSSILIHATTAQSALDAANLAVVFENYSSTASFTITLGAGDDFSSIGIGAAAAITCATGSNVIIGGKTFADSSRFLTDDGEYAFTITTAATAYVYAIQQPSARTGV